MAEIFNFYVQDNRTIQFPKANLLEPIMQEDHNVAVWRFRIPKVLNDIDMSGYAWWFVYVNAKGQEFSELLTLVDDIDEPDSFCTADYSIDYGISYHPGNFQFSLEAINADSDGEVLNEWHTKTYSHKVDKTLQGNQAQWAETESDIISALIIEVQNKVAQLVGGATPEPVSLIADMTDTKKVYLYVGSETGESTNYWYYYNGSAWVAGGLYASGITVDAVPTQGSSNAVSSGGVYEALAVHPVVLRGENQYIAIGAVNSTLPEPAERTGYKYAIVPCNAGDEFLMESLITESGVRVWGFADNDMKMLSVTNGYAALHQYIVAPANAKYFVVNNKAGDGTVYKGYLAPTDNQTRISGEPIPSRHIGADGTYYYILNGATTTFVVRSGSTPIQCSVIPCSSGDIFTLNARGGNLNRAFAFAQKDGTILQVADSGANLKNYQVTAPANSDYLIIQDYDNQLSFYGYASDAPAVKSDITILTDSITALGSRLDDAEAGITDIETELSNEPITAWVDSGYINTGIADTTQAVNITHIYASDVWRHAIIDCAEGDSFILNVTGGGFPRAYTFLDSNNLVIERADVNVGLRGTVVTAPSNCAKLVLNDNSGLTSYYGKKSIDYRVHALEEKGFVPGKLIGKILVNFGDSIFGRGQGATGISGRLAYKTGATVYNLGMSGTAYTVRPSLPGYAPFEFCNIVDAIATRDFTAQDTAIAGSDSKPAQAADVTAFLKTFDFATVDYATIGLGTNDWGGGKTLENASDPYDKTTICGALRYGLETLLSAYPKIIFVILSTIPRFAIEGSTVTERDKNTEDGYTLQELNAKLKEVANEYRLKFIDDYNIGFNKWTCSQYYASGDGTHPDVAGFEVIAENISAYL